MKMTQTATPVLASQYAGYVHNCQRNAQCEPSYLAPLPGVPYLQLYVPFGNVQPLTMEFQLVDLCNNTSEQIFPSNFVVGQDPDGNWYGVFKYFNSPVIERTSFVVWFSSIVYTGTSYVERTFFSEAMVIEPCDPLTKIKACQPEQATTTGFDINGLYYGLPQNEDFLGISAVRYFHIAYVRTGKVRELSNKATFKSSLIRNFRTTVEKVFQLETELVPKWYKDVLLAIYSRGAISVNDGPTYLVSDINFDALNDDDLTWKPFAQLKETYRLYFGCDNSECVECCSPIVLATSVVSEPDASVSDSGGGASSSGGTVPVCPYHIEVLTEDRGINSTSCPDIKYWVRLVDDNGDPVLNPLGFNILVNCTADYISGDCATPISSWSVTGDLHIPPGASESYDFFAATAPDNIVAGFVVNSVNPTTLDGCPILLP